MAFGSIFLGGHINKPGLVSVGTPSNIFFSADGLLRGKIYGQFNAKHLYLVTVFMFEAGSAICGAAPNLNALIIGRVVCGVGGAGMYVGVMTLLSVTTTPHERPIYIALTGLTWGLGTLLGPIIGGAFTNSSATWRWAVCLDNTRGLSSLC